MNGWKWSKNAPDGHIATLNITKTVHRIPKRWLNVARLVRLEKGKKELARRGAAIC